MPFAYGKKDMLLAESMSCKILTLLDKKMLKNEGLWKK